jgi:hypothetical protein
MAESRQRIDAIFEMSNLGPRTTGLPVMVWVGVNPGRRHIPGIKVEVSRGAPRVPVSITSAPIQLAGKPLDAKIFKQVAAFIRKNRNLLLAHWHGELSADDLVVVLRERLDSVLPINKVAISVT